MERKRGGTHDAFVESMAALHLRTSTKMPNTTPTTTALVY
jgi:hypothetical protein